MFKRISDVGPGSIEFEFEGQAVSAQVGDTVAAALLADGRIHFRDTPEKDRPRGPFCMMGVCFDCLVVIDGVPNRQACQVVAVPGMKVARQKGASAIGPDDGPIDAPTSGGAA
ncbi:MAG: (2Fe-2S)-binding protein [Rhodospirillaceae bacterium]|jgi:D-hydroxyproline dehydrogenase subunit gamma|nr:(2Fe-2S)-binding protein [Rhodospirillaceae bacterium]